MKIEKEAIAGSVESSDVLISVAPATTLIIDIKSSVEKQFGRHIRLIVAQTLETYEVKSGHIILNDAGALDYVIKSRLITALSRSSTQFEMTWEVSE